jgi:DedD protein
MTEWNDEHDGPDDQYAEPGGTGKVLFYFFAVVVLCAVSVGIGYLMGRHAAPATADEAAATPAPTTTTPPSGAAKPGASRPAEATPAAAAQTATMPLPETPKTGIKPAPAAKPSPAPAAAAKPATATPAGGFMVQVAAVTRKEEADTLAAALSKKKYPVFVVPAAGADKFFHVQVGPFGSQADAEAMKTKLAADGYNAIVKK